MTAAPGTFVAAPPGVVHTFRNASDATVVFLNFHVPSSGFGDHIRGRGTRPSTSTTRRPTAAGRSPTPSSPASTRPRRSVTKTSLHRILCDLPQLTAIDMTFEPEFEGVDPHTHGDHVDSFYVLEGQVEFRVGDEPRVAGPGTFVAAPPDTVHGFRDAGPEPIRFLNLHTPPGGLHRPPAAATERFMSPAG